MISSFKIAICDDSENDAKQLLECCKKTNVLFQTSYFYFSCGQDLIRNLENGKEYDIVFLDVDMPNLSGVETGKIIRDLGKKAIIIFITSYPQYAIEAYDCEAFSYILKPCDVSKLTDVLKRVVGKLDLQHAYHIIKVRNESRRIKLSDIYYVECSGKNVVYHLENEIIKVSDKISNVYQALKDYGFCQSHQAFVVNMEKIAKFDNNNFIVLINNERVDISVRKRKETLLAYTKYIAKYQ